MTFDQLPLIQPILKSIAEEGYTQPTPIQEQAIPPILKKKDLLGCAQTGTGKTAAFAIPILQLLAGSIKYEHKKSIRALIVTPTRELAIQILESFETYGKHLDLSSTVIFGGVGQAPQVAALKKGVDILVATPGRLLDLVSQKFISLREIEFFVLDEADRMLDMGFIHDIKKILQIIPKEKQSLFFSATMAPNILTLAESILHNPVKVEVTPISSTADTIQQFLYYVPRAEKNNLLLHQLNTQDIKSVLVFTRTKHGADKVVKFLQKNNVKAEAIHGNKAQNARQRALTNFKDGTTRVLVATDIAARGIDVDDLQYVINYEIPEVAETYVHRIGRTGRAGASGTAYSFCNDEEFADLKQIEKLIGKSIPVQEIHPFVNEEMNLGIKNKSAAKNKLAPSSHIKTDSRSHKPSDPQKKNLKNKKWYGGKKNIV
jgi:ATP-dependent RNA helicase RhlE